MKKLLLLLFTLFTSLSGAWAVSPNASAYPKIGRTYYLTVSKDATKRYIYNDGGTFNFIYNIPQIIFSAMISGVINFIIKYLSLSQKIIIELINKHNVSIIAIGNGTASRETEAFETNQRYDRKLQVFVVSED